MLRSANLGQSLPRTNLKKDVQFTHNKTHVVLRVQFVSTNTYSSEISTSHQGSSVSFPRQSPLPAPGDHPSCFLTQETGVPASQGPSSPAELLRKPYVLPPCGLNESLPEFHIKWNYMACLRCFTQLLSVSTAFSESHPCCCGFCSPRLLLMDSGAICSFQLS